MKKNVTRPDRILRFIVAAILIGLYAANILNGTVGIIALIIAAIMIITASVSFCPLYAILGCCKSCGPNNCSVSNEAKKNDDASDHCSLKDKK